MATKKATKKATKAVAEIAQNDVGGAPAITPEVVAKIEKDFIAGAKKLTKLKETTPVIENAAQQEAVAGAVKLAKSRIKEIEAYHEPMETKAKSLLKEITDKRKGMVEPYAAIVAWGNQSLIQYATACEERDRKLLEAAEAEQKASAEKTAEALRASGLDDLAADVLDAAETTAIAVAPSRADVGGLSFRESFDYEIVDASKIKPGYLIPNEKLIGATVRDRGRDAIAMIGEGSIKVIPKKIPVHSSKK